MDLFNYYDNFVVDILMRFLSSGTTKEELDDKFKEVFGANSDKFYNQNEQDISNYYGFLAKDDEEYVSAFEGYDFPVLLNKIEQEAITNAVNKPVAITYLTDSEISTIKAVFNNKAEWDDDHSIIQRFKSKRPKNKQSGANIKVLIKAIIDKKQVCLTNVTRNTVYENQIIYPLRLEYTTKDNRWTLTGYSPEISRVINMNVGKLKDISVGSKIPNMDKIEKTYKTFLSKTKKVTAVIKLKAKNYDLDRFFRVFSYYKRDTKYNKKTDEYTINLEYYLFDESALVIQLLSFGGVVEVVEPESLRQRMIEELL
mgnify:CR=1 FL=1